MKGVWDQKFDINSLSYFFMGKIFNPDSLANLENMQRIFYESEDLIDILPKNYPMEKINDKIFEYFEKIEEEFNQ